ncbi:MAG: prephenate dehydrogenase/arogenate dehydrogenase family protein [Pirellulaceae bacterium]|jgi:prephenate dehydrogenase|nr:prephenate dehydrogenase/arogenate dehydrogenase family protein [Pirellulaceae bacterium]MDP7014643.1 prephenate dehydrogenase/arogenate dehydrogenase family protein [Pirellulaceae bacterium]
MPHWKRVTIVGVGLIGGSIGSSLRRLRLADEVIGVGRSLDTLSVAEQLGAITSATTDWASGLAGADVVVVCTPVEHIPDHVRTAAQLAPQAWITDAGSAKSQIVQALRDQTERYIGSHPLAGSEKTGCGHSRDDLFVDRVAIVTPTDDTPPTLTERASEFWRSLGANVVAMSPSQHDDALAATSHLPHVVASALAAATDRSQLDLTGTGWRDATRIASGDVEMWRQILTGNQTPVLQAIDRFSEVFNDFREALADGDQARIQQLLEVGKQNRDAVGS